MRVRAGIVLAAVPTSLAGSLALALILAATVSAPVALTCASFDSLAVLSAGGHRSCGAWSYLQSVRAAPGFERFSAAATQSAH